MQTIPVPGLACVDGIVEEEKREAMRISGSTRIFALFK